MTNYEKIMQDMTIEQMAQLRIRPSERWWYDGHDCLHKYAEQAIAAEIAWLEREVTP